MESDHHDDHHDLDPENHDQDHHSNVNKTSPVTPRWNPTKDQINMLEGLYKQGIRTPSAEQIQQITTRLRAFGHIEGKNVFYWFQNHKARQRQKQKQESMAYINRFLHRSNPQSHPLFHQTTTHHIPAPNVVCAPYYAPIQTPSEPIGALHHQSNASSISIVTRTTSRKSPKFAQKSRVSSAASGLAYDHSGFRNNMIDTMIDQETLPLFPLCPTGDLQGKNHDERDRDVGVNIVQSCEVEDGGSSSYGGDDQTFYDFFSR